MNLVRLTNSGRIIQLRVDQSFWSTIFLPGIFLLIVALDANAQAYEPAAADGKMVIPAVRADQSVLLDVVAIGERLVAVGERGHILLSDDEGRSWQQSLNVPTRTLLTSITVNAGQLWVAGHASTILTSLDNGDTWQLQYSDINADPILGIYFDDAQHGYAVGAYGLFMRTENSGEAWNIYLMNELIVSQPVVELQFDETESVEATETEQEHGFLDQSELVDYEDEGIDYHLNGIIRVNSETLLVAAESGHGYYSRDDGETWQQFRLPYDGSMFGALSIQDGRCVLVFGLRGNVFKSCDAGYSDWISVNTGVASSLFGASQGRDGQLWLTGANGTLLQLSADAKNVKQVPLGDGDDLTSLTLTAGHIILLGESGLQRMSLDGL